MVLLLHVNQIRFLNEVVVLDLDEGFLLLAHGLDNRRFLARVPEIAVEPVDRVNLFVIIGGDAFLLLLFVDDFLPDFLIVHQHRPVLYGQLAEFFLQRDLLLLLVLE